MKGIIIAAGYGTRFLPCTKTVPKEMFPLIDTPAIDFIVEEFINSGIKEILIVTSRRKKILEDYFDREIELETVFLKENSMKKLDKIKVKNANFYFTRQPVMLGTGHAILICKEFAGSDPVVIAYPDDLIFTDLPLAKQLISIYDKTNCSVLACQMENGDVSRYGVLDFVNDKEMLKINKIIEKPEPGTEPSKMISIGRYLFTPEIFNLLENDFKSHSKGEFYHINAINTLASNNKLYGCQYDGIRLDIGDKIGYLEGIIKYGLQRKDLADDVKKIIKKYYNSL